MERKTVYHKSSSSSLHNPSFSSFLLDSIYRSIDEEGGVKVPEEMAFYKGLTVNSRKNRPHCSFRERDNGEEEVVEKRMMDRRKTSEKVATTGRKSSSAVLLSLNSNSSSSSSDSSLWSGGLSSSESESFYCPKSTSSSSSSCYSMQRPKPVRTHRNSNGSPSQKSKKHRDHEEVLAKKKSKALKIYAELKKAKSKQPISPGSRLASFLNSLFVNTKKKPKTVLEPFGGTCDESSKVVYSKSKSTPAYCPSSASTHTRSCLSKTPSTSSGGKPSNNNGSKRSVRFDPVSVIVDEETLPCGRKNLQEEAELKIHAMEESRTVAEATRKLLESYQGTKVSYDDPKDRGDDEDVDDGESCSSSDLFELDNLSEIGIDRYRDELPVYETTHVDTNRAIASGLIL